MDKMNPTLAQLAHEAGITVTAESEKFAELIAYECIDLALGSSHREDDMGAIIANKIRKHFKN